MTPAKTDHRFTPWYAKAGAATSIVPLARFVSDTTFALKNGGYGCLLRLTGVDEEGLTDQELESRVRTVEGALRPMPEGSCLTQYSRVISDYRIPRQPFYPSPVTEEFVDDRIAFLHDTARFRRIDLHWCLTLEPANTTPFQKKPKAHADDTSLLLLQLEKVVTLLQKSLDTVGIEILNRKETLSFFAYLFNLEPWAENIPLHSDLALDRQIARSPIEWREDHLRIGKRFVQMFSLSATPESSRPCLFADLLALDCDAVLCSTWRPKSSRAARKEIEAQEKFNEFFKVGVFQRVMSGNDFNSLDKGAGAKAASKSVDDLSDTLRALDKKTQGEYSLRLLISANSHKEIRRAAPEVHRAFMEAQAPIVEETVGNLSAFYAMFPGNGKYNVFPLWLSEDHHARLSSIYAPNTGTLRSEDLEGEYLNVFETRTRTPYFMDPYIGGVRVSAVFGTTGSGKSVWVNQIVALDQKYGGYTYIFDIGGSYEQVVRLYGGKVDRVGKDGPRINPFALEPTAPNLQFLYSFVKLLLTNGGASLTPEDDDTIYKAVADMYNMEASNRRLRYLFLPIHLNRYLAKWINSGVYNAVFDNIEDSLSLSRLQCFDFQGVNADKQYADLIEPLMVWILRRINDVVYNPDNLGIPKHIVIEELFSSMKNEQLLQSAIESIKTARKHLGGVTLIGQSATDLGVNADTIVNSCTSLVFLPHAKYNREYYQKLFKLTNEQLDLFESLQPREALYMNQDGISKVLRLNLDARSYAKFSTRPKDKVRRSKLIDQYGLEEGIKRFAAGEEG